MRVLLAILGAKFNENGEKEGQNQENIFFLKNVGLYFKECGRKLFCKWSAFILSHFHNNGTTYSALTGP